MAKSHYSFKKRQKELAKKKKKEQKRQAKLDKKALTSEDSTEENPDPVQDDGDAPEAGLTEE